MSKDKKNEIINNLNYSIGKLRYLSDSMSCWNDDQGDFNQDKRVYLSCTIEDVLKDIETNINELEKI